MSVTSINSVVQQQQEANESPEAWIISALLEQGEFNPDKHRLSVDMLGCWQHLWSFAVEYQAVSGKAPPLSLIARKWPEFEPISGLDVNWAAGKLREAHYNRETRKTLHEGISALREGEHDKLTEAVRKLHVPPSFMPAKGMRSSDPDNVRESASQVGFTWPYSTLQARTMGLASGELTYLAARYGQGKSNDLCWLAAWYAEMGLRVRYVSIEMPKRQVNRRINRCHARGREDLRKALMNPDAHVREAALGVLHKDIPGWVEVIDPSDMTLSTKTISAAAQDVDIVMVDHAGILKDSKGRRPVEDWRVYAEVSNTLKEIALSEGIAMLAAAQLNREGEARGMKMPSSNTLGGSDALGQDADNVIIVRLLGERSQIWKLDKVREATGLTFYTKYEPTFGEFSEISKDEAMARAAEDEANHADD